MKKKYFQNNSTRNEGNIFINCVCKFVKNSTILCALVLLLFLPINNANAQNTYTLGDGTITQNVIGITPFSTETKASRTQYLYYGQQLLSKGASSGNIVSLAFNFTDLALPSGLYPENVIIKMKLTPDVYLGTTLVNGLPEYYSKSTEVINSTGWHTFVLNRPFEWDGYSNILIEVCRTNTSDGTSFGVQSTFNGQEDYRSIGLYSISSNASGCNLTGVSGMVESERRYLPNVQFTMTDFCEGTPIGGVTAVSAGPYCDGATFQLSVTGGEISSGLTYRWESSPNQNGPWTIIPNAKNTLYETTQATATYYRRKTTCILSGVTTDALAVLVDGTGCYCNAEVTSSNSIGINNVKFNTINNTTPTNISYANFTSIQTEVNRNSPYNLSAKVTTIGGTNFTKAWIDWNKNGEYDANEGYDLGTATGNDVSTSLPQDITIPADAALGATNMRIRTSQSSANNYPAACGIIANGETEDYTIMVLATLGVNQFNGTANQVLVYKNQNDIVVEMQNEEIADLKVYDLSGRLLWNEKQINQKMIKLDKIKVSNQLLIFQITTQSGTILYKKQLL